MIVSVRQAAGTFAQKLSTANKNHHQATSRLRVVVIYISIFLKDIRS